MKTLKLIRLAFSRISIFNEWFFQGGKQQFYDPTIHLYIFLADPPFIT
jgi:hypothetical protein